MQIAHDGHAPMQKMGQNACVQISNMNENVQNVGHWRQTCMSMVMKGTGSLSAALPCFVMPMNYFDISSINPPAIGVSNQQAASS